MIVSGIYSIYAAFWISVIKEGKIMKRKKADIASFFSASGKKSAKAKNEGEMEKKQAESEDEEPPESSNLNGPPGIQYRDSHIVQLGMRLSYLQLA